MKEVLEQDNPILRKEAEPVSFSEFESDWLKDLIKDMIAIMKEKGAVGIAAPQIGVSKRVIVFGTAYTKRRRPEVEIPDTVLINPTVKALSDAKEAGYEGCLNSGDLMGEVPRAIEVEYSGFTLVGTFITKRATGLEARIIQHEVDHLNGFLFLDRIEDTETITTYSNLQKRL